MNTPSRINTGFQLCDGSDSEGKVEDASINPTLSHVEALELQKISRIAELIETQEDFLTRIYEGVCRCFPHLSFALIVSGTGCSSSLLHTANIKTSSSLMLYKYSLKYILSFLFSILRALLGAGSVVDKSFDGFFFVRSSCSALQVSCLFTFGLVPG